jgi:hypothetical protein
LFLTVYPRKFLPLPFSLEFLVLSGKNQGLNPFPGEKKFNDFNKTSFRDSDEGKGASWSGRGSALIGHTYWRAKNKSNIYKSDIRSPVALSVSRNRRLSPSARAQRSSRSSRTERERKLSRSSEFRNKGRYSSYSLFRALRLPSGIEPLRIAVARRERCGERERPQMGRRIPNKSAPTNLDGGREPQTNL